MPTVNAASLRRDGRLSAEADAVIGVLVTMLGLLVAVFLERATPKTPRNSSLPPSQADGDGTARRRGFRRQGAEGEGDGSGQPAQGHRDRNQPGHRVPEVRPRPVRNRVFGARDAR